MPAPTAEQNDRRTPLHVLTGFLGSGKTTLLRRVLAATEARIAVLVNEVADLPIDARLLGGYDEDVLALPGGCVCCVLRGDLYRTIARLRAIAPARIVLETSGLADPAPVLAALASDPRLAGEVRLAGVAAVADAERIERLLDTEIETRRQLDLADRIAVSKADLAPHRVAGALELLARDFPGRGVRVLRADSDGDADWLFAPPFADGAAARWLVANTAVARSAGGHGAVTTRTVSRDGPVDVGALQLWLRLVTQLDGERLLRAKAVVRCAATGECFALQSAGRSVSPPLRLDPPPPDLPGGEVVVIARGMPPAALERALTALRDALAGTPAR